MTEQNCILSEFFLKKEKNKQNKEINTQTHTQKKEKKKQNKNLLKTKNEISK